MSYYNRYNCYSCGPCNNRGYSSCDNCSASCCIDCMNYHRELFNLNDDFKNYLERIRIELNNMTYEIKNSLTNSYNIKLSNTSYSYYEQEWKDFLYVLEKTWNEINNLKYEKESQIYSIKKKYDKMIEKLKLEHKKKMDDLNKKFVEQKINLENNNLNEEDKMNNKLKQKDLLIKSMKDINSNKESILNKYEGEELTKADLQYNKDIQELNHKYNFKEEKLEYTDDEIKLKQQYLDEIQKIKIYSKNPFYTNLITSFGLSTYIN